MDTGQSIEQQLLNQAARQTKALEGIYALLILWLILAVVGAFVLAWAVGKI
jgi:CHASE3 domain sensor protein